MTYNLSLTRAAAQVAVSHNLVPAMAITALANPGDTSVHVPDVRPFLIGTIFSVWDGTAEGNYAVLSTSPAGQGRAASPVPGIVTLDFAGKPNSGLLYAHSPGAIVATNVLTTVPVETGEMLENGWPVLSFFIHSQSDTTPENDAWEPRVILCLIYQLRGDQDQSTGLHSQLYIQDQTDRCIADVDTYITALKTRSDVGYAFVVNGVSYATGIESIVRKMAYIDIKGQTPHWELYADIRIIGPYDIM